MGAFIRYLGFLTLSFALICLNCQGRETASGSEQEDRLMTSEKNTESKAQTSAPLSAEEGAWLISIARKTIEARLFDREIPVEDKSDLSPKFSDRRGTFVTLSIDGGLRGCIGHIIGRESVLEGVKENAINAAFRDPRFRPLTKREWEKVRVEVSILTDPKPLIYEGEEDLLSKLRPNVDGVIIKKGYHQATFLPQVWEQLPGKSDFLTHLCLKAGLDGDAWRKEHLDVSTYQAQAFEEE